MTAHVGWADSDIPLRMSWDEYNELGDGAHGEFIDGALLTPPTPDRHHQEAILHLVSRLSGVCAAGEGATTGWGWSPSGVLEEYVPDVMVYPATPDQARFTGVPLLCVEVTSGNRSSDLILKRAKYASAGLRNYWVVERRDSVLRQYELREGLLMEFARHAGREPIEIRFADRPVTVDLGVLLRP